MAKRNESSNVAWFLAGMTVGLVSAILFAPKSGRETRGALADAASRGKDIAERTGREVTEMSRDVLDHGRSLASEAKEVGKEALDMGKKVLAELNPRRNDSPPSDS